MIRYFFPKTSRLLKSHDFRLCAKHGQERKGQFLYIRVRKTTSSETKLGLTVPKRYGKAVCRNRIKRLIREAFRCSQHELPKNVHINVHPRHTSRKATLHDIHKELTELL